MAADYILVGLVAGVVHQELADGPVIVALVEMTPGCLQPDEDGIADLAVVLVELEVNVVDVHLGLLQGPEDLAADGAAEALHGHVRRELDLDLLLRFNHFAAPGWT